MMYVLADILRMAFFLQVSYLFSYIPLIFILLSLALWHFGKVPGGMSFLISIQSIFTAYLLVALFSGIIGLILTYFNCPIGGCTTHASLYYHSALIISVIIYSFFQSLLLFPYKQNIARAILPLVMMCNMIACFILMSLHVFLFLRHMT